MPTIIMTREKNINQMKIGDEAPSFKDMLFVLLVILILVLLSWIAYFKFGWLH